MAITKDEYRAARRAWRADTWEDHGALILIYGWIIGFVLICMVGVSTVAWDYNWVIMLVALGWFVLGVAAALVSLSVYAIQTYREDVRSRARAMKFAAEVEDD